MVLRMRMQHDGMAGDWLSIHPLGNPGIVAPNIDMSKCKTTISMSETTLEIEKLKAMGAN